MYNHILVAVDGSETSNRALNEAMKLAAEQHATLRLVHVIDLTQTYMDVPVPAQIIEHQEQSGRQVLAACHAFAEKAGLRAETGLLTIEGPGKYIYDAIAEQADRWPADLIVIGTHGRRGIRRFILGSVAEGLIRVATKPVLLIRGD